MKKKIGIMGGTFNPIHYGHLILAERARESFSLDYVIFIPSGLSYMKDDVLDSNIRYQMTALAIKDNPNFKISAIETNRIGNSYTYETLEELSLLEKEGSTFYFIIGEDSLFNIEQWKFPERIFQLAEIIVAKRMESSQIGRAHV